MKKLVCESLEEYNLLNEADDEGKKNWGPLSGAVHTVKTAPGRVLRKARAQMLMKKYKQKLTKRINDVIPKYEKNINQIVEKTKNRYNQIESSSAPETEKKHQIESIKEELENTMRQTLENIRKAMDEQLRVYAESLQNRLEREGTITGVKFFPEEKANLLSQWRRVETEINALIQKNLINLLDNVDIVGFQEIKAKLDSEIRKIKGSYRGLNISDESNIEVGKEEDLSGDEKRLYQYIVEDMPTPREFNINYLIKDTAPYEKEFSKKPDGDYVKFVIDAKTKKTGYVFSKYNRTSGNAELQSKEIIPFIEKEKTFGDGINRLKMIISMIME